MSAYGTDQGLTDWLAGQGLSLPQGAPANAVLREVGSAYVDAAYEHRLQCSKRAGGLDQERAWPRTGHKINGETLADDYIPLAWVTASYRAAYLQATQPGWATGSTDPNRITRREQVDTISREFFAPADMPGSAAAPGMPADAIINGMVLPLLCSTGRNVAALLRVI